VHDRQLANKEYTDNGDDAVFDLVTDEIWTRTANTDLDGNQLRFSPRFDIVTGTNGDGNLRIKYGGDDKLTITGGGDVIPEIKAAYFPVGATNTIYVYASTSAAFICQTTTNLETGVWTNGPDGAILETNWIDSYTAALTITNSAEAILYFRIADTNASGDAVDFAFDGTMKLNGVGITNWTDIAGAGVSYGTTDSTAYRGDWGAMVSNWGDHAAAGYGDTYQSSNNTFTAINDFTNGTVLIANALLDQEPVSRRQLYDLLENGNGDSLYVQSNATLISEMPVQWESSVALADGTNTLGTFWSTNRYTRLRNGEYTVRAYGYKSSGNADIRIMCKLLWSDDDMATTNELSGFSSASKILGTTPADFLIFANVANDITGTNLAIGFQPNPIRSDGTAAELTQIGGTNYPTHLHTPGFDSIEGYVTGVDVASGGSTETNSGVVSITIDGKTASTTPYDIQSQAGTWVAYSSNIDHQVMTITGGVSTVAVFKAVADLDKITEFILELDIGTNYIWYSPVVSNTPSGWPTTEIVTGAVNNLFLNSGAGSTNFTVNWLGLVE